MTTLSLVPKRTTTTPIQSAPDASTTHPEAIRLHGLASNALTTALHLLNKLDTTPEQLQQATARAVRAATLLKRASTLTTTGLEG